MLLTVASFSEMWTTSGPCVCTNLCKQLELVEYETLETLAALGSRSFGGVVTSASMTADGDAVSSTGSPFGAALPGWEQQQNIRRLRAHVP